MPLLGLAILLCRPIRMLVGGAFIFAMVCLGLLIPLHFARLNAPAVAAAISAPPGARML